MALQVRSGAGVADSCRRARADPVVGEGTLASGCGAAWRPLTRRFWTDPAVRTAGTCACSRGPWAAAPNPGAATRPVNNRGISRAARHGSCVPRTLCGICNRTYRQKHRSARRGASCARCRLRMRPRRARNARADLPCPHSERSPSEGRSDHSTLVQLAGMSTALQARPQRTANAPYGHGSAASEAAIHCSSRTQGAGRAVTTVSGFRRAEWFPGQVNPFRVSPNRAGGPISAVRGYLPGTLH